MMCSSESVGQKAVALEQELETYKAKLPELLDREGDYVVITEDRVIGVYGAYEDALRAGYEAVGEMAFLVQQIKQVETLHCITRDIADGCPT